jgi:acyl-ACP thioesterase
VARWLQDVAADDIRDTGADGRYRWVVRRSTVEVVRRPVLDEPIELVTWCSGTGAAWAERRTSIRGRDGGHLEAASVWVSLDPASLRPCPLGLDFMDLYGPSTGGRVVRSRNVLDASPPDTATHGAWTVRLADLDVLGHVNNAVAWAVLEEEVARQAPGAAVTAASVEYRSPIGAGVARLDVAVATAGDDVGVWLSPDGEAAVVAHARTRPAP